MRIQRVSSKWEKTKVLLKNEQLRPYIPDTRPFTNEQLAEMLEQYNFVFVKPDHGTYGNGVMSIERYVEPELEYDPWVYKLRYGIESMLFGSLQDLQLKLKEKIADKSYLIQRGINLIKYDNRKFDLRVLVQKNLQEKWETTGYIGRVAAKQKIITNYHSGGMVASVEELMNPHLNGKALAGFIREMRQLGELTGRQLGKKYPRLKEIGLDIAVDPDYRIWILEVNTLPALFPFKMLNDKNIYKKIQSYAIHYGRLKDAKKSS